MPPCAPRASALLATSTTGFPDAAHDLGEGAVVG
jgi:hypothetical protein